MIHPNDPPSRLTSQAMSARIWLGVGGCVSTLFYMPNIRSTVKNWNEIKDSIKWNSLILGNGASIAISDKFSYASLKSFAFDKGYVSEEVKVLFDFFRTDDFEYLLGMLFNANVINHTLEIKDQATAKAYSNLKKALIKTIGDTHVSWHEAKSRLSNLALFMKRFRIVVSLNYDLVVYWAMLVGNDGGGGNYFKDCFIRGRFYSKWRELCGPHGRASSSTLVFYPHGNLVLMRDIYGVEKKIVASSGSGLLGKIFSEWNSDQVSPLFVSEGTSNQKLGAIYRSEYLRTVYEDVLPNLGDNIVIYGWNMAKNDMHVLNSIMSWKSVKNIALSVHMSETDSNISRKLDLLKSKIPNCSILLFE